MSVLLRTNGITPELLQIMKTVADAANPHLTPSITPLRAGYAKSVTQVEEIASIVSMLGGVATFLAVVGLFGLVSYAVSQRTKELAIRLALGARRIEIFTSIARRFAWPVLAGMVLGITATAAVSQLIRRALYGISGLDPASYIAALALLTGVLGVAAMLPIRRAFRIDIASNLHSD
jgi:ABC-type antimicrobial peptide transport system permease subunit